MADTLPTFGGNAEKNPGTSSGGVFNLPSGCNQNTINAPSAGDLNALTNSVSRTVAPSSEGAQPDVIKKVINRAAQVRGQPQEGGGTASVNKTPGMNGVRADPWTGSGMQGQTSEPQYFNPGSRGNQPLVQYRNRL